MDKLKMQSKDLTKDNIERIEKLFPNVITETKDEKGNITKAIDFELLQQELSDEIVEGSKERYQLTWPGKKEAIVMGNTPIDKTLRPVKEDSLNWEDTENLYIEGDNLEVLKLLQESYLGKIKCIYIDPPYNTGNDFIYRDNFAQDRDEYAEESGQVDEEGNRLFQNTEYNGRYHSDWLTMMYPRLKLARNLLSDDGVIFISIDDNEVHNLRKICDEIFGERNFVAQISIITGANQSGDGVLIQKNIEYCLVYGKNISETTIYRVDKTQESWRNLNDAPTPLITRPEMGYTIYYNKQTKKMIPIKDYDISKAFTNDEEQVYIDNTSLIQQGFVPVRPGKRNGILHRWRWGMDTFINRIDEIVIFEKSGKLVPCFKQSGFSAPKNYQNFSGGTVELKTLFSNISTFDYPKSTQLIEYLVRISATRNDIILDFFSGSATTAHAVMDLNAEDGGNRKYIMVQLPEPTDEKSEAYKAGYENIAEIGKERIRRAGKKIKEETGADIDYGFRVYKVDSTNMKDVYYLPEELDQNLIEQLESNIKEDRTGLDLLTQVMLETGLELSLPMETREIRGKEVHFVAENSLVACFDKDVDEELIKEIAKIEPLKAVFRDKSFSSCPDKINLEEIFKGLSPNTDIRVL